MSDNDLIDMNKRTVKELVISLHDKMQSVEDRLGENDKQHLSILLDLNTVKTKMAIGAAAAGFIGGILGTVAFILIEYYYN